MDLSGWEELGGEVAEFSLDNLFQRLGTESVEACGGFQRAQEVHERGFDAIGFRHASTSFPESGH